MELTRPWASPWRGPTPPAAERQTPRGSPLCEEPRIRRKSDGGIEVVCGKEHLDGFKRFAELADAIARWLEEKTSRRARA